VQTYIACLSDAPITTGRAGNNGRITVLNNIIANFLLQNFAELKILRTFADANKQKRMPL